MKLGTTASVAAFATAAAEAAAASAAFVEAAAAASLRVDEDERHVGKRAARACLKTIAASGCRR